MKVGRGGLGWGLRCVCVGGWVGGCVGGCGCGCGWVCAWGGKRNGEVGLNHRTDLAGRAVVNFSTKPPTLPRTDKQTNT